MINFSNSKGQTIARIDRVAQVVYSIMTKIDLIREATQAYNHGTASARYSACNVLESIRLGHYVVREVESLPEDKLPSECHIG